jgi:phospholipid/cholesterol/gamma-HCH transport system permease protein
MSEAVLRSTIEEEELVITAVGSWTSSHMALLEPAVDQVRRTASGRNVAIDMRSVDEIDTFGACLIERLIRPVETQGKETRIVGLADRFCGLVREVAEVNQGTRRPAPKRCSLLSTIELLGKGMIGTDRRIETFIAMLGAFGEALIRLCLRPRGFRLTSFVHQLDRVGLTAVPIVALITFLIGCIIAQQSFFSFKQFGADTYIVNLLAFLVLRELGVLVTAIMSAGRSGSSYTAEIGSMKMREEIDALRTMGLDPIDVLLLPRILALVVALPLLTFLGFIMALYGGGLVAWFYGGMSPPIFLARLREVITVTQLEVGMIKAPFMALAIGIIACAEGLAVKGSAESLGLRTTSSVVASIFCIILLDGLLDLFFAAVGM